MVDRAGVTTPRQLPPTGQRVSGAVYVGSRLAAGILGVDERTVRRWAEDGAIVTAWFTDGGHRRFHVRHLEAVARRTPTPTKEDR